MKKVHVIFLIMATLLADQLYGQFSFSDLKIIDSTQYDANAEEYLVDLDGDQDVDLLSAAGYTANPSPDALFWYEQDADHNFLQKHTILPFTVNNYVTTIAPVDIDDDGDLDLVVIQLNVTSKISWYENDGAGHFSNNHVIAVVTYACYEVSINDLDRDGDLDIILLDHINKKINWFENYGSNQFGLSETLITATSVLGSFVVADLDGIENLEILYLKTTDNSFTSKSLHCAKKDGTGLYATDQILSDSINNNIKIITADWDHDNILDILAVKGDYPQYDIVWFKNDGNAHFGDAIYFHTANTYLKTTVSDFDGDGDNDLVALFQNTVSNFTDSFILFTNNGPDLPLSTQKIPINSINVSIINLINCFSYNDDGDQNQDLLLTSDREMIRIKNNGGGLFDLGKTVCHEPPAFFSAQTADIDGDGKRDIASFTGYESSWYKNLGNGQFAPKARLLNDSRYVKTYFADLDNDNDLDMVRATSDYNKSTSWYRNDGSGHFSLVKILNSGIETEFTTLADYDGDGDIDIIYYVKTILFNNTIGYINAYRNNGAGSFTGVQLINLSTPQLSNLKVADLDGNQKVDIYYIDSNNSLIWYENDGAGNFINKTVIGVTVSNIRAMKPTDMDHDGDVDLFFGAYYEPNFYLYKNDGLGNFTDAGAQTLDIPGYVAYTHTLADIDNDGDPDVVIGNDDDSAGAGGTWIIENSGDGTLVSKTKIFNPASKYLFVDDLDIDGDLDIIWQNFDPYTTGWLENIAPVATKSPAIEPKILSLAPNPASTETILTIKLNNLPTPYLIEIQDISGSIVRRLQSQEPALKIQRNNLPAGSYFVRVREAKSGKLLGVEKLIWR